jgi:hypothetical protein
MADYELATGLYLLPTPAGAYHAVSGADDAPLRRLILSLLREPVSPRAELASLCRGLGVDDEQEALQLLHSAQTLGWVEGFADARSVGHAGAGSGMHQLLPSLSALQQGLLVDWNGLTLASCGIGSDLAESLAALAADLVAVQERHAARLSRNLGLATHGWAAVDAYGSSRVGAWPLYVGAARLMLVLLGEPQLHRREFLELVWLLVNRYG